MYTLLNVMLQYNKVKCSLGNMKQNMSQLGRPTSSIVIDGKEKNGQEEIIKDILEKQLQS